MAIYLIDYENTKNLTGINNLSAEDKVYIFYSQKANSMSFDTHKDIIASKANVEYKFVEIGGQNALDFQLSSYLGYIIDKNENKECEIFIVSKDKGFSFVTAFWKKEKAIDINIVCDLEGKKQSSESDQTDPNSDIESALKHADLKLSKNETKEIIAIVKK